MHMKQISMKLFICLVLFALCSTLTKGIELNEIQFFNEHPELQNISTLSLEVDKEVKKLKRPYLGAFGIGGLNAFTLVGLSYPLNTYHNTTTYYHPFFSYTHVGITIGGEEIDFPRESIWYVRDTSVTVTKEENDSLAMFTVNFSPPESGTIVRIVVIKAKDEIKNLELFAHVHGDRETAGNEIIQIRDSGRRTRTLRIGLLDGDAGIKGERLVAGIPELKKGEEKVFYFYYIIQTGEEPGVPPIMELNEKMPELLSETIAYWKDYLAGSTKIITPDRRLNDMLENLKIAHKIQQNENGAMVVVVKYADRSHDRENIHVTRYYLMMGMPEDAKRIMKYGFLAAQKEGIIYNSQAADLDLSDLPETTDWENIPLDNHHVIRHVAERPSWTALQFVRYYRYTGDLDFIREVYPYLRRNMLGQEITPEGLLPFHGDEMYQLTYPTYISSAPLEKFYSLDSSLAFAAAAKGMEEIAEKLDKKDDKAKYAELRERVEAAIEKYYWMDKGYYATGLRKDGLAPLERMFPLISLNPGMIGYEKNTERQRQNLESTIKKLRRKDGSLRMAPAVGMYHGQLQGMYLYSLKRFRHPLGERVFDLLVHKISDPAGMYTEVQANNHSHMSMSKDPTGKGKEDARRFGPWESALNISSLVYFLTGMEVDAGRMEIKLIPELPNGWDKWEMLEGKIKRNSFDFFVEDTGTELSYRFENKGPEPLSVSLALPIGKRVPKRILVNGEEHPLENLSVEKAYGRTIVGGISRKVDKELLVRVEYE